MQYQRNIWFNLFSYKKHLNDIKFQWFARWEGKWQSIYESLNVTHFEKKETIFNFKCGKCWQFVPIFSSMKVDLCVCVFFLLFRYFLSTLFLSKKKYFRIEIYVYEIAKQKTNLLYRKSTILFSKEYFSFFHQKISLGLDEISR